MSWLKALTARRFPHASVVTRDERTCQTYVTVRYSDMDLECFSAHQAQQRIVEKLVPDYPRRRRLHWGRKH